VREHSTQRVNRLVLIGVMVACILAVAAIFAKVAHPATEIKPEFGALTSQAYSTSYQGAVLAWAGWVVGFGGNQYGYWFDLADVDTQSSIKGKTIRCYYPGGVKITRNTMVIVVGQVKKPGQIKVLRLTVDFQNQPPLLSKFKPPIVDKQPAQE